MNKAELPILAEVMFCKILIVIYIHTYVKLSKISQNEEGAWDSMTNWPSPWGNQLIAYCIATETCLSIVSIASSLTGGIQNN